MSLNSGETLQPFKALNQLIFDSSGNLIGIQNDRAVGNDLRIGGGSGVDGTFATLVATTALKLNSGAVFELYNTADQTTNYERLRADWSANIARIFSQNGGTGTTRELRVGATNNTASPTFYTRWTAGGLPTHQNVTGGASAGSWIDLVSGSFTGSSGTQSIVIVAPTINQSGTAGYTAFDINPTESATGSGTKLLQRWAVGGTEVGRMTNAGIVYAQTFAATNALAFSSSLGGTGDVTLVRDAADILAQRRTTNAQTFRVYNTYTDASNYERLNISAAAGSTDIFTSAAGTGTVRSLRFGVNNAVQWQVASTTGNLLPVVSDTYALGGGSNWIAATYNNYHVLKDGVTAPSAVSGQAILYVDTADGDLKIIFGDGTIKTIVTDT